MSMLSVFFANVAADVKELMQTLVSDKNKDHGDMPSSAECSHIVETNDSSFMLTRYGIEFG